jgi:hypothetical protein
MPWRFHRYPAAFAVIQYVCVDAKAPLRHQILGMQFCHQCCEVSTPEQLAVGGVGNAIAVLLLKILEDPSQNGELQGLAYSALGKLARRVPAFFRNNFDVLEKVFRASLHKDGVVRANVRDALAMMKESYVDCGGPRLLSDNATPSVSSTLWCLLCALRVDSTELTFFGITSGGCSDTWVRMKCAEYKWFGY